MDGEAFFISAIILLGILPTPTQSIIVNPSELRSGWTGTEYLNDNHGSNGRASLTETYIVYDNWPELKLSIEQITFLMAKSISNNCAKVNGFYIESNKISLAKQTGCAIAIEDDPRIALSYANSGIKVVLLLRKWNRLFSKDTLRLCVPEHKISGLTDNICLAEDWIEADAHIEALIKQKEK